MQAGTPRRSSFVDVLAWLFIITSGVGVVIGIVQSIALRYLAAHLGLDRLIAQATESGDVPALILFTLEHVQLAFALFLGVSVLGLVASIGLLRRLEWARKLFMVLMVLGIVWSVAELALVIGFFAALPVSESEAMAMQFDTVTYLVVGGNVGITLALSTLFAWLIYKLCSAGIRAEFR